jgi:hypothetical protein
LLESRFTRKKPGIAGLFPIPQGAHTMKNYVGTGVAIGIAVGASVGAALHNVAVGIGIGAALGAAFGAAMNRRQRDSN